MSKRKGSRTERELFHMLWDECYAVMRAAGSGSTTKPSPDLIASDGGKVFAIECKAIKSGSKYFDEAEIQQLLLFAKQFGAEPWLAIKFDNKGWYFVDARKIEKSKGDSYVVNLPFLMKRGLVFNEFIGKYRQERLNGK